MKKILHCAAFWVICALAISAAGPVQAKDPIKPEMPYETAIRLLGIPIQEKENLNDHDPAATAEALRALLAVANDPIPVTSSCQGHYAHTKKPTIKDLLAPHLSHMYPGGGNVIQGNCESGQCVVFIVQERGEFLSTAIIVFNMAQGKASVPSLQCMITP